MARDSTATRTTRIFIRHLQQTVDGWGCYYGRDGTTVVRFKSGGRETTSEPTSDSADDRHRKDHDQREQNRGDDESGNRVLKCEVRQTDDEQILAEAQDPVGHRLRTGVRDCPGAGLGEMTAGRH